MEKTPLRVMIVDNHPTFWDAARWALTQDGRFTVVAEVHHAGEAILRVGEEPIDLVLLGLRLPDLDMLQTVQRLRARRSEVIIILVASDIQAEHQRQARRAEIRACLIKDEFTPASLAAALAGPDAG